MTKPQAPVKGGRSKGLSPGINPPANYRGFAVDIISREITMSMLGLTVLDAQL